MDISINEQIGEMTEQKYQLLFENMLNGFAYCKMLFKDGAPDDFVYLQVNRAFSELTGLKDVVGKAVTQVIPDIKKDNPELFGIYGRVAKQGKPEKFELYLKPLALYLSISVYCPEQDHFVAVFENITEEKNAQESLQKDEERLRLALKASKMGVFDWDIQANRLYWSPELLSITGKDSIDGTMEAFTEIIYPDDVSSVQSAIKQSIEMGIDYEIEFRIVHVNGRSIWLSTFGEVIFDEQKKPLRMVGTARDITESKENSEALREKSKELEKFVALTVGRELQMTELKNKIKELEGSK